VCLAFRRRDTGEVLLEVGGRWDRIKKLFVGEAEKRHVFWVNDSQIETVLAFREWLHARLSRQDRKIILFTGGKRRGGKTVILTMLLVALCIALPEINTWAVSATIDKREEIERAMILKSLHHHAGNLSRVAESLGMSRAALYRRLEKYGIRN
jgi:transcriptional regulator with AAA-type ATPase domain